MFDLDVVFRDTGKLYRADFPALTRAGYVVEEYTLITPDAHYRDEARIEVVVVAEDRAHSGLTRHKLVCVFGEPDDTNGTIPVRVAPYERRAVTMKYDLRDITADLSFMSDEEVLAVAEQSGYSARTQVARRIYTTRVAARTLFEKEVMRAISPTIRDDWDNLPDADPPTYWKKP